MKQPTIRIIKYDLIREVEMIDYKNKLVYCHLTDDPEEGDWYEFGFDEVEFLEDNSKKVEVVFGVEPRESKSFTGEDRVFA